MISYAIVIFKIDSQMFEKCINYKRIGNEYRESIGISAIQILAETKNISFISIIY